MDGKRALILGSIAAAAIAGAAAARAGWRPAIPGSGEPELRPIGTDDREWLESIARQVDPAALRAFVESMPGPRNRFEAREAMVAAEDVLVQRLSEAGWAVERRPYVFRDTQPGGFLDSPWVPSFEQLEGVNLLAVREGRSRDAVVVIAHYDTVAGTVGADDNTASVAALLDLARLLGIHDFEQTLILAATDMEDAGLFGAYALAPELVAERRIRGVICFDTMAYTSHEPGSQTLPGGIELLFPGQVARLRARDLRGEATAVVFDGSAVPMAKAVAEGLVTLAGPESVVLFRDPRDLPVSGRLLRRLPAVRNFSRSDHRAFWDHDVPAVLVSDTANFRYPHYHEPTDTPEKLDYERLAAITAATAGAVARTAGLVRPSSTRG